MNRPNIVMFVADEFRADRLGHIAGTSGTLTPNLDRLVQEDAVSFTENFCQNPVCTPSRCSLMTGWYPHTRGHRTMHHLLHPDEPNLLKLLKDSGYTVWWGGKNDLISRDTDLSTVVTYRNPSAPPEGLPGDPHTDTSWRGEPGGKWYQAFLAGEAAPTRENGDRLDFDLWTIESACRFIASEEALEPFALFLPITYPHPPYYVEKKWKDQVNATNRHIPAPEPDWDTKPSIEKAIHERRGLSALTPKELQEIPDTYDAMCMRVDHQAGMILDALREAGAYDNTAFFFLSDHGDYAGDYQLVEKAQNCFEDALTHTPMIIKPPAGVPIKAGVRAGLTENIDFFATLLDLAGISSTESHFGRSLIPYLTEDRSIRDYVCAEGGRLRDEMHCREAEGNGATDPYDLYYPRVGLQQAVTDPMYHTKATMLRTADFKYVRRLYESDELYDLKQDPKELHNVINDPAYANILLDLKDKMLTFLQETTDVVPLHPDNR